MPRTRDRGVGTIVVAVGLALTGCSGGPSQAPTDALERYTDPGDACPQAVSAIGYADDRLVVLGQECYQEFDSATASRLAAVAGTLSLERRDWPDRATREQAERLAPLADTASELSPEDPLGREEALVEYRIEAARLVLLCGRATGRYP